jgi:hypothetical protein
MSWRDRYQSYTQMTISELKELLKSSNLPVSGKKVDLISYLIFKDYPQLAAKAPTFNKAEWLIRMGTIPDYAAINNQYIKTHK